MAKKKNFDDTLRSSNVAIGNPLEMGVSIGSSIGQSSINSVFSLAMFDCQRVMIVLTRIRRRNCSTPLNDAPYTMRIMIVAMTSE